MAKQRAYEHTSYEVRQRWDAENLKKITIALPKEMASEFKEKCAREGIPQAQVIKKAIDDFLNDNDKSIKEDVKLAETSEKEPNTGEYTPDWLK